MRVVIEKSQSGKTFGISLMDENDKPYLVIKNCKIAKRADGTEFVSPPSVKMDDGKWLNHAYISTSLQNTVLQTLDKIEGAKMAAEGANFIDDDIPL
jgi:hypothetical protein